METHLAHVQAFVEQLLDTGGTLVRLVDNLTDAFVEHDVERGQAAADVFEMLVGTVGMRFASVTERDVTRAAELMDLAMQSVLTDLRRALAGR
ncbi:MAG TPA: hypothetical protein VNS09_19585 [Solirubrobacter sp.]|nr:hypothetical protein [Solirubrobacter sp.]